MPFSQPQLKKPHRAQLGLVAIGLVAIFFTFPSASIRAAGIPFKPEVKIPGVFDQETTVDNDFIGRYIRAIYVYFIWTVGVLAAVMITFGGVKWVAAAGNAGRIQDARDLINSSIIGIIIALTSVVLLNLISPQFTIFKLPDIKGAQKTYFDGAATVDFCPPASQIECGVLRKLDFQIINRNGVKDDAYCIGTSCSAYASRTCALDAQAISPPTKGPEGEQYATYYVPSGGCVKEVPIKQPAPGDYSKYTSLEVHAFQSGGALPFQDDRFQCGRADARGGFVKGYVGSACRQYNNWETCYFLRSVAEVLDRPGDSNDQVRGMGCP